MQRDIGNEFIVAIIAVGILAFAVAFAIILSLSGGAGQSATPSPQATNQVAQISTAATTRTATGRPQPTDEKTEQPTALVATSVPSNTSVTTTNIANVQSTTSSITVVAP